MITLSCLPLALHRIVDHGWIITSYATCVNAVVCLDLSTLCACALLPVAVRVVQPESAALLALVYHMVYKSTRKGHG